MLHLNPPLLCHALHTVDNTYVAHHPRSNSAGRRWYSTAALDRMYEQLRVTIKGCHTHQSESSRTGLRFICIFNASHCPWCPWPWRSQQHHKAFALPLHQSSAIQAESFKLLILIVSVGISCALHIKRIKIKSDSFDLYWLMIGAVFDLEVGGGGWIAKIKGCL